MTIVLDVGCKGRGICTWLVCVRAIYNFTNMFSRITAHLVRIGCMTSRLPTHFKNTRHLHLFCNCLVMFHITGYDFGCFFAWSSHWRGIHWFSRLLPIGIPSGRSGNPPSNSPGILGFSIAIRRQSAATWGLSMTARHSRHCNRQFYPQFSATGATLLKQWRGETIACVF